MPKRHIVAHTSMRGVAALLVLFYHLQFGATFQFSWETATGFFRSGYLWVDLFFVLSGFVISYSVETERSKTFSRQEVESFLVARIARIYPLHFACLVFLLAYQLLLLIPLVVVGRTPGNLAIWSGPSIANFFEQLFLLNAWGISGRVGWNIPSWSISAELVAYLCFPIMVALVVKGQAVARFLLLGGAIAFYAYVASTTGVLDIVKGLAVLRCLAGFILGMMIYYHRGATARLSSAALSLCQAGAIALILATLTLDLNDVLAVPAFVLLVASTWTDNGVVPRLLANRPLIWLGDISYSIYLTHVCLLMPLHLVTSRLDKYAGLSPAFVRGLEILSSVALVLAVSTLTYRWIETPARRRIVKAHRQWRARRTMALA